MFSVSEDYSDLRRKFSKQLKDASRNANILRDDKGRPLLLFHGSKTPTAIDKFGIPSENGAVRTWLSTSIEYATGFAEEVGKVYVCVASIQTMDNPDEFIDLTSTRLDCTEPLPTDEYEIEDLAFDISAACGCDWHELVEPLQNSDDLLDLVHNGDFPGF